ncbi:IclR family transcriptional regulator [Halorarius litoreus]|uniref:IclR family transcriptional regulator n=1 Tax=Halorarius litoreus TaxID=2962676 RepID=UPI0020CD13EF|nr:IclR family transcriptional regulator [Halorarius litoreus]
MNKRMPVKTTEVAFDVVEALLELEGARFTDLVDHMDMPKSTLHDHLRTLESMGVVVKSDNIYRVGSRFLELGARARKQQPIYEAGRPEVEDLAKETGEHASLSIEERGRAVLLHVAKGTNAVNLDAYAGRPTPLHANAAGKVMLAHLPEERIDEIIEDHGLAAYTTYTITDPAVLKEELETIREQRYATDTNELVEGVKGVAAPILDRGAVVGAIAVGGPANRMRGERFDETLPDLLLSASNIIELNLTYG